MWHEIKRALLGKGRGPESRLEVQSKVSYQRLGSDYGGYALITDRLAPGVIVYSFGIGEDITFDLAVIERAGAVVHAFDPTPRSQAWIAAQTLPPAFRVHPYALGASDGTLTLYPPKKSTHVSYSEVRRGAAEAAPIHAPCKRLGTIMAELGHTRLDVLKMDIEGSEYAVLNDVLAAGIDVEQLLVEFHHDHPGYSWADTERAIAALNAAGYKSYYISDGGQEFSFARG